MVDLVNDNEIRVIERRILRNIIDYTRRIL